MLRFAPYLLALFVFLVLPVQSHALMAACCQGNEGSGSQTMATHDCCPDAGINSGVDGSEDTESVSACSHCSFCNASASLPTSIHSADSEMTEPEIDIPATRLHFALIDALLRPPRLI